MRLVSIYLATMIAFVSGYLQADSVMLRGNFQQGGLLLGKVVEGSDVYYLDKPLQLTDDGYFILGLSRDAPESISLRILNADEMQTIQTYSIDQRQYQIQRVNGVPSKTVTPAAADLARIRSDSALVKKARRIISSSTDFLGGFQVPLSGPITGVYGSQRVYNGVPKTPHYGVDYAGPTGAIVVAPASGSVRMAHRDMFYSGGTLIMDHGHGLSSSFLHLSDILVAEGDTVVRGQPIAKVGATGRATGPHLDWRMNWHQVRIDPELVMQVLPVR